jgi:hypothetical protein
MNLEQAFKWADANCEEPSVSRIHAYAAVKCLADELRRRDRIDAEKSRLDAAKAFSNIGKSNTGVLDFFRGMK